MLSKLKVRYESLMPREQIVVILTLLLVLLSVWDKLYSKPFAQQQTQLTNELTNLEEQIKIQQHTVQQIKNHTYIDPNLANQNKLTELKARYSSLQEQMMLGDKKFVPPQLMPRVLNDILNQNSNLSLKQLDTLPITKLVASSQEHPIFKHGLTISFSGNYQNTLNFFKALEALPWAILWDTLEFEVKSYPVAETTIKVYTLSFEENWLGL